MDGLNRLDVAGHAGMLTVVVESELLLPNPAVVVIPLLRDYPAVRRGRIRRVGNVAPRGDAIARAVDVLMSGV